MKIKSSIQFEEHSSEFNVQNCLFNPESNLLFYVEGAFLLSASLDASSEDGTPSFEFSQNIKLYRQIKCKQSSFFFIILEDDTLAIIDLKSMKVLNQFPSPLPAKIRQIRQKSTSESVFILTEAAELFEIDNFVLFTRLTPELLHERFMEGKVLKEYRLEGQQKIFDFIPCEGDNFFTVGSENMCAWWSKLSEAEEKQQSSSSSILLNYFSKPKQPQRPHHSLKCNKILNESDRSIERILCSHSQGESTFVVVEDSQHGRVLVIDLDLGLVLKVFKGYRNCASKICDNVLNFWAENRHSLERWSSFPFCKQSPDKAEEFSHSQAFFDINGNFFVYNVDSCELNLMEIDK